MDMRHKKVPLRPPTRRQKRRSTTHYVVDQIHDGPARDSYLVRMRDTKTLPGHRFASLIKDTRTKRGWRQEDLEDASGVSRQTIIRYESGRAVAPRPEELRAVCRALGVDVRDAIVALGLATREELNLPPEQPRLPAVLQRAVDLINDPKIPERPKSILLKGIDAAIDLWFDSYRARPPREPSAAERNRRVERDGQRRSA